MNVKRYVSLLVVLLFALGMVWAQDEYEYEDQGPLKDRFRVGFYMGSFNVKDQNLARYYTDLKNLFSVDIAIHTVYNIDVWASYKQYKDTGVTSYLEEPLEMKITPLLVGLRYRLPKWKFIEPFVGAGLSLYSYQETAPADLGNTSGSASGFHFQGGVYANVYKFVGASAFIRYNAVKKNLAEGELDLGGLEYGIGIVFRLL